MTNGKSQPRLPSLNASPKTSAAALGQKTAVSFGARNSHLARGFLESRAVVQTRLLQHRNQRRDTRRIFDAFAQDHVAVNHQNHLAAGTCGSREVRRKFTQASPSNLFVKFRQLARNHSFALTQNLMRVIQRCDDAVWGFVKDQSRRNGTKLFEPGSPSSGGCGK